MGIDRGDWQEQARRRERAQGFQRPIKFFVRGSVVRNTDHSSPILSSLMIGNRPDRAVMPPQSSVS